MERSVTVQEVVERLKHLSTDPNVQNLTAANALIHASKCLTVDRLAPEPENRL